MSTVNVHFMVLQSPHLLVVYSPAFPIYRSMFPHLKGEVTTSGTEESKNKSGTDLAKTTEEITYRLVN